MTGRLIVCPTPIGNMEDMTERGRRVLEEAVRIACENHCYKVLLTTGSKRESTLRFYREAGFNDQDKTAFVRWL